MHEINYLNEPFTVTIRRLWWQKQGLQQTATGYGNKLTTEYMLHIGKRSYRVYAVCFSNVASYHIVRNHQRVWIRDSDLQDARDKARNNN